jgi:hypothetical protein
MKILLCVTLAYFVLLVACSGKENELIGFFEGIAFCVACLSSVLLWMKTGENNVH